MPRGHKGITREGKPSVWVTYNGMVSDLRQEGHTLQSIGDKVGVTRERVRQILKEHYRTAKVKNPDLITTRELITLPWCSVGRLENLKELGLIHPLRIGIYPRSVVEVIRNYYKCKVCGNPTPLHQIRYCSEECRKKFHSHRYMKMTEKQKEAHNQNVRRWMKEHPEKNKEIQNKAHIRYYYRHFAFSLRFKSIIPVHWDRILIPRLRKEEKMYPYETTIIRKEEIPVGRAQAPRGKYDFLGELLDKLEPGQAIRLTTPEVIKSLRQSICSSWRRLAKGRNPHTRQIKQADGSYFIYFWLGD